MICPNCNKVMNDKSFWASNFHTGPEDDGCPEEYYEKFYCKDCKIKYLYDEWKIPKKFIRPTEKQLKAILFIKNRIDSQEVYSFEPLLKDPCTKFISKYFDKAKSIKILEYDLEEIYDYFPDEYF